MVKQYAVEMEPKNPKKYTSTKTQNKTKQKKNSNEE